MFNYLYSYFYNDKHFKEFEIDKNQRRLRHLLHRQINLSKINLRHIEPIVKTGIYELDKASIIPIPEESIIKTNKMNSKKKKKKH